MAGDQSGHVFGAAAFQGGDAESGEVGIGHRVSRGGRRAEGGKQGRVGDCREFACGYDWASVTNVPPDPFTYSPDSPFPPIPFFMPRSTIRLPAKHVHWAPRFRTSEQLPEILSSRSLFGNDRPLEIEVGSGKGLFLAAASKACPEHNFLGIEIADRYARHAAGRIAAAHGAVDPEGKPIEPADRPSGPIDEVAPGNAMMIAGNAEPLFATRIPPESLEAVHVYFPDPWWKKRHRKRRVVNETSVLNIFKTLRPGGRFHFWTDVLDYFEVTIEMIAASVPRFGVPIPEEEAESGHPLDYRTHFEKRSRENAIPVYRVRYEKRPAEPV